LIVSGAVESQSALRSRKKERATLEEFYEKEGGALYGWLIVWFIACILQNI